MYIYIYIQPTSRASCTCTHQSHTSWCCTLIRTWWLLLRRCWGSDGVGGGVRKAKGVREECVILLYPTSPWETHTSPSNHIPEYLVFLVAEHTPARSLLSSQRTLLLNIPKVHKSVGDRAFSAIAPRLWNELSDSLRTAPSLEAFKSRRRLKIHLFDRWLLAHSRTHGNVYNIIITIIIIIIIIISTQASSKSSLLYTSSSYPHLSICLC